MSILLVLLNTPKRNYNQYDPRLLLAECPGADPHLTAPDQPAVALRGRPRRRCVHECVNECVHEWVNVGQHSKALWIKRYEERSEWKHVSG